MARNDSFRVRWASNPAQFERPQTSLIERGWAGGANEDPPEAKWENWWHNRVDEALAELEAHGALRWFSDVPYQAGAVVWHAGQRWLALDESVGVEPGGPLADGVWAPDVPIGKPTADPAEAITGSLLSGAMLAAGAIVEMGQNANGFYVRWESGLQVCVMRIPNSEMTANTVYTNTIPFPAGFFRDDVVYPLVFPVLAFGPSSTSDFAFDYLGTIAITAATFNLYAKATVTQAYPIRAIAIGRWK